MTDVIDGLMLIRDMALQVEPSVPVYYLDAPKDISTEHVLLTYIPQSATDDEIKVLNDLVNFNIRVPYSGDVMNVKRMKELYQLYRPIFNFSYQSDANNRVKYKSFQILQSPLAFHVENTNLSSFTQRITVTTT